MLEQKQGQFRNLHEILIKVIQRYWQILIKNSFIGGQISKVCAFLEIILVPYENL